MTFVVLTFAWITIGCGYIFTLRTGRQVGHIACLLGGMLITWEAADVRGLLPRQYVAKLNAAEPRPPTAVLRTPDADRVAPFVASVRLDSKVYHMRGCSKFGDQMRIVKEYATEQEAREDGRRPCSYCLNAQASAPVRPPGNPTESKSGP